jgi:hypothetical protein
MRTYEITDAFEVIRENFSFLLKEWGFDLVKEENLNYMCALRYRKNNLMIVIVYEYMYNMFDFEFNLKGQRILFVSFFKEKEPNIEWRSFIPDDFQYKESLMRNIEYLKKYKDDIIEMSVISGSA